MAHPITSTTRVAAETRLQDLSSLDDRILRLVELLLESIRDRLTVVEEDIAELAAAQRGQLREGELTLRYAGLSGSVLFAPEHGFAEDTIDRPVLVQPYVTEGGAVLFSARVIDTRSMLVQWVSIGPAPQTVTFAYLIG